MMRKRLQWAIGVYLLLFVGLILAEPYLLYPSPSLDRGDWDVAGFRGKETYVASPDGTKVVVWTMLHPKARATIVFAHGNGENLGLLGYSLVQMRDRWRVNIVAFDYRGYGKTGGTPTEKSILADSLAVGEWVHNDKDLNGVPIVPLGRSLGGACAVEIATKLSTPALIIDRSFSSTVDVAASKFPVFPVRWVMRNRYPSILSIAKYNGKLLQLHGEVDEVVPYRFGKKLYDACPSPQKQLMTIRSLRHNDLWPEEFWEATDRLIGNL